MKYDKSTEIKIFNSDVKVIVFIAAVVVKNAKLHFYREVGFPSNPSQMIQRKNLLE